MIKNIGICFWKDFIGNEPLSHLHAKRPVYLKLLELIQNNGFKSFVLTKKTYEGNSFFNGGWVFDKGKFKIFKERIKIDLIYDRVGGVAFPPADDDLLVVDRRDFKLLCWDKFKTYEVIGEYMPQTFWVGEYMNYLKIVDQIKSGLIVLKPFNGLKGLGIYIGPKEGAKDFDFREKDQYIAQEFIDTSGGLAGVTPGSHDLRVVVVNGKVVWCHVRVPAEGKMLANAAQGGTLAEVDFSKAPDSVKKIVKIIAKKFYQEYDNPVFSLDFGMKGSTPYIFEINDQIGFPKWEMKNHDIFLNALVKNFKSKLQVI